MKAVIIGLAIIFGCLAFATLAYVFSAISKHSEVEDADDTVQDAFTTWDPDADEGSTIVDLPGKSEGITRIDGLGDEYDSCSICHHSRLDDGRCSNPYCERNRYQEDGETPWDEKVN